MHCPLCLDTWSAVTAAPAARGPAAAGGPTELLRTSLGALAGAAGPGYAAGRLAAGWASSHDAADE
jgi:hypothetical protein